MGELLVWNVGEISYYIELNAVVPLLFWILVRGKGLTFHNSEILIDGSLSNKAKQAYLNISLSSFTQGILLDLLLGEPLPESESVTGIKEGH